MNLGKLKIDVNDGKRIITGYLRTYKIAMDFKLEPVASRMSEKSPTHDIIARSPQGHTFNAGVAWEGEVRDRPGEKMFNLSFSVPEVWEEEFALIAFDNKAGAFEMRVSKKMEQSNGNQAAA